MTNIFSKTNTPYLVAGALATLTLLASGVFAAAPYIGFLAPVAALSVGLPFIIGCAVFSVVTIALSYAAVSKNKTISKKDIQLAEKVEEISKKDAQLAKEEDKVQAQKQTISELEAKIQAQEQTISGQNDQLTKKEAEVKAKEKDITVKDDKLAKQVEEIEGKGKTIVEQKKLITGKDKKIEEDALKVAIADGTVQLAKGTVNGAVWFAKGAVNGVLYSGKYAYDNYVPSTESVKGALGSVGNKLKNGCGTSIEYVKGELGSDVKNTCSVPVKFIREIFNSSFKIVRSLAGATTQKAQPAKKDPETSSMQLKHNQNEAKPSEERELTPMKVTVSASEVVFSGYCKYLVRAPLAILRWPVEKLIDNAYYYGKYTCNYMPSDESARNWVPSLKTAGWIAGGAGLLVGTTYITVNGGFTVADNSSNAVGNSTNDTESDASISNSSSGCYRSTDQQIKQSQIHEINKKLADANKWYEDNYGTPKEDSLSNKGIFSSICNKVSSVWSSLGNLISGSNESAHNHSEPQWYKNLYKSEDLEEIIDDGVLDNLFSSRVSNSINTSKQKGTLIDSVDLEKLIQEPHPSAYPNGSSRIL